MSIPPHPRPPGDRITIDEIIARNAVPYSHPLAWETTYWSRQDSFRGAHWDVWVRDATGRLAATASSRWKWRALRRARREIREHDHSAC